MNRTEILARIQANVERLSAPDLPEYKYIPLHQKPSPSVETLAEVMRLLRTVAGQSPSFLRISFGSTCLLTIIEVVL